ncbi:hypothetical protein [Roseixanthobacter liquoris]
MPVAYLRALPAGGVALAAHFLLLGFADRVDVVTAEAPTPL